MKPFHRMKDCSQVSLEEQVLTMDEVVIQHKTKDKTNNKVISIAASANCAGPKILPNNKL